MHRIRCFRRALFTFACLSFAACGGDDVTSSLSGDGTDGGTASPFTSGDSEDTTVPSTTRDDDSNSDTVTDSDTTTGPMTSTTGATETGATDTADTDGTTTGTATDSGATDSAGTDSGSDSDTDTDTPCMDDIDCDDGLYCTGVETCQNGICQPGEPIMCDDGVDCTVDSCDEFSQSCLAFEDDAACSDGLFCNGAETCDIFNGCQPGTPPNCVDETDCTVDACDEDLDQCTFTPNHAACDDGSFCNGAEMCDPVNGCQAGTPPSCEDFLPCTIDTCDDDLGDCVHTPDDMVCQNGIHCDGAEVCDVDMGCMPGADVTCTDDGFACTIEQCTEAAMGCTTTLDNTQCAAGEFCTDGGCVAGDPCTTDAECDDGIACNGAETCDLTTDPGVCTPGTAVQCFDGVACTFDECVEPTGTCQFTPMDDFCADTNLCNGEETCDAVNGCQPGTPLNCDDGVACTTDQCFASFGCFNAPDHSVCQDGSVCNGQEVCDPDLGCQPAPEPLQCPGDGVACTIETCDEDFGGCISTPDDSLCACGEHCQSGVGCTDACNVASCDGQVYECGNCLDDDNDCAIDDNDLECFGVCDNNEAGFKGEIPGQNAAPCKMDCYFDDDSGSGNDDCYWSHQCDPLEPQGDSCSYNPNANIPGTGMSCAEAEVTQSQVCEDVCGPVVPNGCDCFGCCEVTTDAGTTTIYLGSEDAGGDGSCDFATLDDPTACHPCTQVQACLNPCTGCEICFGQTELPAGCTTQECDEAQPCGQVGQDPCPAGQFCLTGCCSTF